MGPCVITLFFFSCIWSWNIYLYWGTWRKMTEIVYEIECVCYLFAFLLEKWMEFERREIVSLRTVLFQFWNNIWNNIAYQKTNWPSNNSKQYHYGLVICLIPALFLFVRSWSSVILTLKKFSFHCRDSYISFSFVSFKMCTLCLCNRLGTELGFGDPNLIAAVSENLERMTKWKTRAWLLCFT